MLSQGVHSKQGGAHCFVAAPANASVTVLCTLCLQTIMDSKCPK